LEGYTLDREEISKWLKTETKEMDLSTDQFDHILNCLEKITKWYDSEVNCLGHFLTAIVKNDFVGAITRADLTNMKAIRIYAYFVLWCLPADYIEKAKGL
jgi:hypothetical protein